MGASAICTYIYSAFLVIKAALTGAMEIAKTMFDVINTVVNAVITAINMTISPAVNVIVDLTKAFQKKLNDILMGGDDHFWCHGLFDCLALLNELLDPNSFIFRMIKKLWKDECGSSKLDEDFLNKIREWISNFDQFRQTICKYGFTIEFSISMIRDMLNSFKKQLQVYINWAEKKLESLKKQVEDFLNYCLNTGIVEQLEKLVSFFLCILDESDACAAISTASSFYATCMSCLYLEKTSDGSYTVSSEFKNTVYGILDGLRIRCKNLKYDIEDICSMIANACEIKPAARAFNLSKNVFPANMSWSDFTKADGSFSIGKMFNPDTWSKYSLYQKCKHIGDDWSDLIENKKKDKKEQLGLKELMNGAFIDNYGNMYYKDGCDYIKVKDSPEDEIVKMDIYLAEGAVPSNDVLVDPDTNQIISVTMAAVRINQNPDGKLAERCKKIWSFVNDWQMNGEFAVHGNGVEKVI